MYRQIAFYVLSALLFCGCGASYRTQSGAKLDWIRSSPTPIFEAEAFNMTSEVVWIDFDDRDDYLMVEPFGQISYTAKTRELLHFNVRWIREEGFGADKVTIPMTRSGLYDFQKPLIIDDLFLHGVIVTNGYAFNQWPYPIALTDSRGNNYGIIGPRQKVYRQLASGPIVFSYEVLYPWRNVYRPPHIVEVCGQIDTDSRNQLDGNKLIGWKFFARP